MCKKLSVFVILLINYFKNVTNIFSIIPYYFNIKNLPPGTHRFQLKQIDFDGGFALSEEVEVLTGMDLPYQLTPAHPNPFNPQTTFTLTLAQDQETEIGLYDLLGRFVERWAVFVAS